jgi:hypothetical protein
MNNDSIKRYESVKQLPGSSPASVKSLHSDKSKQLTITRSTNNTSSNLANELSTSNSNKSDKEKMSLLATATNGNANVVLLRKKNKQEHYSAIQPVAESQDQAVRHSFRMSGLSKILPGLNGPAETENKNGALMIKRKQQEKEEVSDIIVINLLNLFVFYLFLLFCIALNIVGLWLFPYYLRTPQVITADK